MNVTWSRRTGALVLVAAGGILGAVALRIHARKRGGIAAVSANKQIARRLIDEVWGKRNLDAIDELVSPDYVGHEPTQPKPIRGPAGFREFVGVYLTAFPDGRITIEDQVAEGDRVATRWTGRGTHTGDLMGITPTGKEVTVSGLTIDRLADGKIVESWQLFDALGMLVQLGAIPELARA